MIFDRFRDLCLRFPGAYEDYPFGPELAVFRIAVDPGSGSGGKIFAFLGVDADPPSISLKCEPALAIQLRAAHPEIAGAWHLNKKHWNGVRLDGDLDEDIVRDLIEDSYDLVVASLPRARREALGWSRDGTS